MLRQDEVGTNRERKGGRRQGAFTVRTDIEGSQSQFPALTEHFVNAMQGIHCISPLNVNSMTVGIFVFHCQVHGAYGSTWHTAGILHTLFNKWKEVRKL